MATTPSRWASGEYLKHLHGRCVMATKRELEEEVGALREVVASVYDRCGELLGVDEDEDDEDEDDEDEDEDDEGEDEDG